MKSWNLYQSAPPTPTNHFCHDHQPKMAIITEIIGEASYMLSLDFKDAHPENISVVTEVLHDVLDCLPPGFCAGTYAPGAGCNYCNENRTPSPVQDQNAP